MRWIPQWWRPISTIRPTRPCWEMEFRVLTRVKMKITVIAAGAKLRDPQLECAARTKGPVHQEKLKRGYRGLSNSTEPWWREGRAGDVREQGLGDRKPRQII